MPTLLTRMSADGSAFESAAQPSAVPRSAPTPRTVAPGTVRFNAAIALSTADFVRPFNTTTAPHSARPLAIAKPIPAVEPVTMAVLLDRSILIMSFSPFVASLISEQHAEIKLDSSVRHMAPNIRHTIRVVARRNQRIVGGRDARGQRTQQKQQSLLLGI